MRRSGVRATQNRDELPIAIYDFWTMSLAGICRIMES